MQPFKNAAPFRGPKVALVRTAKQLAKVRADLGIDAALHEQAPRWADRAGTAGLTWTLEVDDELHFVVYIADHDDPAQLMGVIAHEAVHVMSGYLAWLQEAQPGEETQAYTVQAVVQELVSQFAKSLARQRSKKME